MCNGTKYIQHACGKAKMQCEFTVQNAKRPKEQNVLQLFKLLC